MEDYSDRSDVKARHEAFETRLASSVASLSDTRDGRLLLKWLVGITGVFQSVYPKDHAQAAWDAGRRAVGLELIRIAKKGGVAATIVEGE